MFRIILILICSLVHVYVFWRISSVPFVKRYITYKYMLLIGLLIWVILFSGFFIGHNRTGIPVLRGKWKELKPGLILAGVDSIHRRMERHGAALHSITPALANLPYGAVILLSHFPQGAEAAANAGADLMLCGHTHGGQIWPFSYIVKAFYPLLAGEYDVNGMPVIVTRGAGTWGPRMRLWKRGEILRVTLMTIDDNNK